MGFWNKKKKSNDEPKIVRQNGRNRKLYPINKSDFDENTNFNVDPTLESKNKRYGLTDDGEPFSENKNKFSLRKDVKKYTRLNTDDKKRTTTRDKFGNVYQAPLNEINPNNKYVEEDKPPKTERRRRRPWMRE